MNSTDQTILTINSQNEQDKDVKMLRTDSLLERFKNLFVTVIENDEEEEEKDTEKEKRLRDSIESLKTNKTLKYPDETLHTYINYLSELGDKAEIDFEFVNRVIKTIDINYKNEYGDTALHETCKLQNNQQTEILAKELIKHGIDKYSVNKFGQSVLHIAASFDNTILVKYLLEIKSLNNLIKNQKDSSKSDNFNLNQIIIDHKLLGLTTFGEQQTALHYASRNSSLNTIKLLVNQYKSDLESRDFQGRTAFYLAAEYGNNSTVKLLMELGSNPNIKNIYGQKALYWIIAKCPEIAEKVLNTYEKTENLSKNKFYQLHHIDLEPYIDKKNRYRMPLNKSILRYIVENESLEIITHPVIESLINAKWIDFGMKKCYLDMAFTLFYVIVWHLLAVLVPFETRHIYKFPQDWWRIFLSILAIFSIMYIIINEIFELRKASIDHERANKIRREELENYDRFCHPNDKSQKSFLKQEKLAIVAKGTLESYFSDSWNIFDIISIILLLGVIFTHIADVVNHSPELALNNARIFAVAIIVISFRLFQIGRVMFEKFGVLVVTMTLLIRNIVVWFCVFCVFWIPFTFSFWMLFGYKKFTYESSLNPECIDVENVTGSCKIIELTNFDRFNKAFFYFWMATFGRTIETILMNEVDPILTYILTGIFIAIHILLLINIFIAMLSTTFSRVQDSAKAYFLLQRGTLITMFESRMSIKSRIEHAYKLRKKFIKADKKEMIDSDVDEFEPIDDMVNAMKKNFLDTNAKFNKIKTSMSNKINKITKQESERKYAKNKGTEESIDQRIDQISKEIEEFKNEIKSKLEQKI